MERLAEYEYTMVREFIHLVPQAQGRRRIGGDPRRHHLR